MPITISGSGTITGLTAGGLPDGSIAASDLADNAVTAGKLATTLDLTGKTVTLPAGTGGKVLQIVQTVKSDVDSTQSQDTFVDITGFSLNITPSSTSSKILLTVSIGRLGVTVATRATGFRFMRDSTPIGIADAAGSKLRSTFTDATHAGGVAYAPGGISFSYLDSPSTTSQITYKLQWSGQNNDFHYINRNGSETDNNDMPNARAISTLMAMEISG